MNIGWQKSNYSEMTFSYRTWLHLKNSLGEKAPGRRKILVFLVDDYGNVRLDGPVAKEKLQELGYISGQNRFDLYDTLETQQDLEHLFEVLTSLKDQHHHAAVFTPMALAANIDFEAICKNGFNRYEYETVAQTFVRKAQEEPGNYGEAWALVHQGMSAGIFLPQFHGREHLNVSLFNRMLSQRNQELQDYIALNCFLDGFKDQDLDLISPVAAFDRLEASEEAIHEGIIAKGIKLFTLSYGIKPTLFTSPGGYSYTALESVLAENGIQGIDTYFVRKEHLGNGKYKRKWHLHGQHNEHNQVYLLRNVVFEPTAAVNWQHEVAKALKQIAIAFQWGKPAIISSHRVNFCGHIDPTNREKGLVALKMLLQQVVKRWPEVEFWDGGRLVNEMSKVDQDA